jgi:hypothetical protein
LIDKLLFGESATEAAADVMLLLMVFELLFMSVFACTAVGLTMGCKNNKM